MSSYQDYSNDLLLALYRLHREKGPERYISFSDIHAKAGIEVDDFYLPRFTDEWQDYYLDLSRHLGPHASWSAKMRPSGYNYVEDSLLSLDDNVEEVSSSIALNDELTAEVLPASDRLVKLDHNSEPYRQVATGIEQLRDEFRGANFLEISDDEHSRISTALRAASELWNAGQLKVIQIKVGVIMAIDDAAAVLVPLGKAVGANLLVDLIKQIVKDLTGIEI